MCVERSHCESRYVGRSVPFVILVAMSSRIARWFLVLSLIGGSVHVNGQDEGISQKKQEKILAKKEKEEKKAKVKKEKADRKSHLGIQDKATRKRIKRNTRRADRGGSNAHRDGFFQRVFGHKH